MWKRSAVGCAYHPKGCGSGGSPSNTTFRSSGTYVTLDTPYLEQMVFYGISLLIVKWDGTTATKVVFDTGPVTRRHSDFDVAFNFSGNT